MLVIILLMSCIDDRGTYDYLSMDQLLPTGITGLEESYTLRFGETKHLEVVVEGDQDLENLRYMWYLYKIPNNSSRDTLGYGKTLDFYVKQASGNYQLWFEVRDTVRDICINQMAKVAVETRLSNAWLLAVTKEDGADMDAILADGSMMENIVYSSVGSRLKGNAVKVVYSSEHSNEVEDVDGTITVEKQKAFYIVADQDMRVFNAENMQLLKNTADCFYEVPEQIRIGNCASNSKNVFVINNGKYHGLAGMAANVGKFSFAKPGPDGISYDLHAECIQASQYLMVFDRLSRSFMWAYYSNSELSYFNDAAAGVPDFGSLKNMDVQLQHLMFRSGVYNGETYSSSYLGYAIMKDDAGTYYLADIAYANKGTYPLKDYKAIPVACQLGGADVVVAHQTASVMFFAIGDQLWVHEVNPSQNVKERERLLLPFHGEKITYLRHVKTSVSGTVQLDHLVVVTHSGGKWKLYAFPFIGGGSEFDTTVDLEDVLLGQGTGRVNYCMRLNNGYEY